MKIYIGSDHGGFHLKSEMITLLNDLKLDYVDVGAFSIESVDYGPVAKQVADLVATDSNSRGILICGTGIGMSIMANKVTGIRAAVVHDVFSAEATRAHNDSNILCLGERVVGMGVARKVTEVWLNTSFNGGKHKRRIDFIRDYEVTMRPNR